MKYKKEADELANETIPKLTEIFNKLISIDTKGMNGTERYDHEGEKSQNAQKVFIL